MLRRVDSMRVPHSGAADPEPGRQSEHRGAEPAVKGAACPGAYYEFSSHHDGPSRHGLYHPNSSLHSAMECRKNMDAKLRSLQATQQHYSNSVPTGTDYSSHNRHDTRFTRSRTMIEVHPGHQAHLRGSDETWQAILHEFYRPVDCFVCENVIYCIADAGAVICPDCRSVSPIPGATLAGGVGLGFTDASLRRWQAEIEASRREHLY